MSAPYYGPPQPQPYTQQYQQRPPEVDSIKSMCNIASIFGILLSIIFLLVAIWEIYVWAAFETIYSDYGYGYYTGPARAVFLITAIVVMLMFILGIIFFMQCRKIGEMTEHGQYQQAKSKALIWTIVGIIFVGVIPGIILLIAYLKFDSLIRATQMPPVYGAPAPGYQQPYQQPPPQPAYQQAPPQEMRICPGCGRQIPVNYNVCPHCGRPASPPPPPRQ